MKVSGDYLFDGPQPLVWDTLLDPVVLAGVLPGAEKLELVGENEYEGALKIKVGPVQGQFMGKVKLEDIQPPDSYTMLVDGQGAPGFVKATGHLRLEPDGERTRVAYEGDAHVGGRLASVGQRLVESSAKAIIKQSLDGLNAAVRARAASGGTGGEAAASDAAGGGGAAGAPATGSSQPGGMRTAPVRPEKGGGVGGPGTGGASAPTGTPPPPKPPPAAKPPSQTRFALNVAREVAADLLPPWARYALLGLVVVVVLLLLFVLIG